MARRTIWSVLAAVLLCLVMLPATALAADVNTVYVGGVELTGSTDNPAYATTDNSGNISTDGASADNYNIKWDGSTLTLNGAYITKGVSTSDYSSLVEGAAIGVVDQSGNADLTIQLEGSNTIAEVSTGIYVLASSNSTGDASLTITGDGSLDASGSQIGIRVQSNSGGATLEINSAEVKAVGGTYTSCRGVLVQAQNGSDVSLTVDSGSLTASGDTGICLLFGSSESGSGTPSLTVSGNTIVRASGNAGGIASNASAATPSGTGIVFDGRTGTVYGDVTLQENLEIDEGESLKLDSGASLNVGSHNVIVDGGTVDDSIKNSLGDKVKYAPTITTTSLSDGTVGTPYSQTLAATGSDAITWSVTSGSLPDGLTSENGVISGTPTAAGTSTFTVTATNAYGSDSKQLSISIDAQTSVPVTDVSLDKTELTLIEGDSEALIATIAPANATNENVTWGSSDSAVATVDANGNVTAVSVGTATITVTTEDGSFTDTCEVTVTEKTYTISASPTSLDFGSVTEGYQFSPTALTVTVTNTGNQSVTLTQPTATSYEIGALSATTLAPGETATFTVQPNTGLAAETYSETLVISGSGGTSASVELSFGVSPKQYALTVELNGGSGTTTGGEYAAGSVVQIDAGTRANYRFADWTSSNGGTFADASSSSTSFTMPATDTTITATWQYVPPYVPPTPSGPDWDDVADEIAIAGADGRVMVDMGDETVLPGEELEALAGRDVTLVLRMGEGVAWEICGADVPEGGSFSDTDMGVEMGTSGIPVEVVNLVSGSVQATLAHDGEFGFALTLVAPLGEEYEGLFANAYRYDEAAGALRYEAAGVVDGDGVARVQLDHASQWLVALDGRLHALPFLDADEGQWYSEAVRWAWLSGAMRGCGDGTVFGADDDLTRAQMAGVLYNLAGQPDVSTAGLPSDCDASEWYAECVSWALEEGVFNGYGDGSAFGPDDPLTREQAAAVLMNAAALSGADTSARAGLSGYPDADEASPWAREALSWAVAEGVLHGVDVEGGGRELQPGRACMRAEMAGLLMNLAARG